MNKRQFFKRVATLLGIGAVAPLAQASPNREIEIQRSPVAGFQYHQGEKLWRRLRPGASLALVREPDNPYDPRAVRLDWRGRKLGYVPRRENTAVSQLLDNNQALTARVVNLRESDDPWERIEFVVYLNTGGAL